MASKLSLIIPCYNEEAKIATCLANLENVPDIDEILFADGGSTDGTVSIIQKHYPVIHTGKGRAIQMNTAAKEAAGDIFWFSHADSLLPAEGPALIKKAIEDGARFCCFHISFDYQGPWMKTNTRRSNIRAQKHKIAFGDQGIVLTRELFNEIGGFPELPLMEDYELSLRLKKKGVPLRVLPASIRTSGRRYEKPPLRTMLKMIKLRVLYRLGYDIEKIAQMYKDVR